MGTLAELQPVHYYEALIFLAVAVELSAVAWFIAISGTWGRRRQVVPVRPGEPSDLKALFASIRSEIPRSYASSQFGIVLSVTGLSLFLLAPGSVSSEVGTRLALDPLSALIAIGGCALIVRWVVIMCRRILRSRQTLGTTVGTST